MQVDIELIELMDFLVQPYLQIILISFRSTVYKTDGNLQTEDTYRDEEPIHFFLFFALAYMYIGLVFSFISKYLFATVHYKRYL